jgi:hypothetical protein
MVATVLDAVCTWLLLVQQFAGTRMTSAGNGTCRLCMHHSACTAHGSRERNGIKCPRGLFGHTWLRAAACSVAAHLQQSSKAALLIVWRGGVV